MESHRVASAVVNYETARGNAAPCSKRVSLQSRSDAAMRIQAPCVFLLMSFIPLRLVQSEAIRLPSL
jgi:hypothetical protein